MMGYRLSLNINWLQCFKIYAFYILIWNIQFDLLSIGLIIRPYPMSNICTCYSSSFDGVHDFLDQILLHFPECPAAITWRTPPSISPNFWLQWWDSAISPLYNCRRNISDASFYFKNVFATEIKVFLKYIKMPYFR